MSRRSPNSWTVGDHVSVPKREVEGWWQPMVEGEILRIKDDQALLKVLKNNVGGAIPAWADEWQPLSELVEVGES